MATAATLVNQITSSVTTLNQRTPPAYVKPFVKRQKNDMTEAEAICEAAVRPSMRFVSVKNEDVQGAAMPCPAVVCLQTMRGVFRVRELLIRKRTQVINARRVVDTLLA